MSRDALYGIVALVVLGGASLVVYHRYDVGRPCHHVVAYSIGSVDPRFDIATSSLKEVADSAAQIWNTAEGKTLLVYRADAPLTINLIYDTREESAQTGLSITKQQAELDAARATLEGEKDQLKAEEAAYSRQVQAINGRGGASRSEVIALSAARATLEARRVAVNADVARFNAEVASLNQAITAYNTTSGHSFQEGQYVRDASGERVNIFEFIGTTQLERVLAHELGHAIGLEHNSDPASIMYAENESGNLVPTAADKSALADLCGS